MTPQEIDNTFQTFLDSVNRDKNVIIFLEELLKINPKLIVHDLYLPSETKQIGNQVDHQNQGVNQRTREVENTDPI